MNLLDENIGEDQRDIARARGLRVRQIGHDIGRSGMQDQEIISLLHALGRSTLFTLDRDFWSHRLCHPGYCLVYLDVEDSQAALMVRRVLRHPALNTQAKRMGTVIRAGDGGLRIWRRNVAEEQLAWPGG
jgi:hypothetical protein